MQKVFLILLALYLTLAAYSDVDMDGVEDSSDKCPNTLLTDIVDIDGCTKKSLVSNNRFDVIFGLIYSSTDSALNPETDTVSKLVQVDYYNNNFSFQVAASYFNSSSIGYSDSGMNDSTISMSYRVPVTNLLNLQLSGGVILPTSESDLNNNSDYFASVNASYEIDKASVFAGYNFTLINDKDVESVIYYQNTKSYSAGVGYNFSPKFYANISYFTGDSIDKYIEDIQSASIYMFYTINANWFTNFSYSVGLSDSASKQISSVNIGCYF